jgi:hypothetical protein
MKIRYLFDLLGVDRDMLTRPSSKYFADQSFESPWCSWNSSLTLWISVIKHVRLIEFRAGMPISHTHLQFARQITSLSGSRLRTTSPTFFADIPPSSPTRLEKPSPDDLKHHSPFRLFEQTHARGRPVGFARSSIGSLRQNDVRLSPVCPTSRRSLSLSHSMHLHKWMSCESARDLIDESNRHGSWNRHRRT